MADARIVLVTWSRVVEVMPKLLLAHAVLFSDLVVEVVAAKLLLFKFDERIGRERPLVGFPAHLTEWDRLLTRVYSLFALVHYFRTQLRGILPLVHRGMCAPWGLGHDWNLRRNRIVRLQTPWRQRQILLSGPKKQIGNAREDRGRVSGLQVLFRHRSPRRLICLLLRDCTLLDSSQYRIYLLLALLALLVRIRSQSPLVIDQPLVDTAGALRHLLSSGPRIAFAVHTQNFLTRGASLELGAVYEIVVSTLIVISLVGVFRCWILPAVCHRPVQIQSLSWILQIDWPSAVFHARIFWKITNHHAGSVLKLHRLIGNSTLHLLSRIVGLILLFGPRDWVVERIDLSVQLLGPAIVQIWLRLNFLNVEGRILVSLMLIGFPHLLEVYHVWDNPSGFHHLIDFKVRRRSNRVGAAGPLSFEGGLWAHPLCFHLFVFNLLTHFDFKL